MKAMKLSVLLMLSLIFFTNCTSNEEVVEDDTQTETLNGVWTLKNVKGGIAGINLDYNEEEVKWEFNLEENTVTVQNNVFTQGPENIHSGLSSGVYDIEIKENGEVKILFVEDKEIGKIVLDTNLKIEDNVTSDGFVKEFVRETETETLNGVWNLKNIKGGITGINLDYNEEEVKWEFNLEENTVTVQNNVFTQGPENIHSGLSSGVYDTEIKENGEIKILFVEDKEIGKIVLDTNLKIEDNVTSDGFVKEFTR